MLSFLNISTKSLANESVYLSKDSPAPFSGFLLPQSKVLEFRNMEIKNKEYKLTNESLERSIVIYKNNEEQSEKQIDIALTRNTELAKELASARSTSDLQRIIYVLLGAAAMYGGAKVAKTL